MRCVLGPESVGDLNASAQLAQLLFTCFCRATSKISFFELTSFDSCRQVLGPESVGELNTAALLAQCATTP